MSVLILIGVVLKKLKYHNILTVAQVAEQLKINEFGLDNLANKINSIAPKNQAGFAPEMVKMANLLGGQ